MEDKYRKLVDERIGRALEAGSTGATSSPKICSPGCVSDAGPSDTGTSERDELRKLLDAACRQRETRRRILRRRAVSLAAVFVCIFSLLGGLYFKGFFQPEESQADRNKDKPAAAENGSIVIGGNGSGNLEMWTAVFSAYEDIPDVYRQEMVWFDCIPEGYEVRSIEIQNMKTLQKTMITLQSLSSEEIRIEELKYDLENDAVAIFNNYEKNEEINGIEVYSRTEKKRRHYAFYFEGTELKIKVPADKRKETEAMIASVRTDSNMW
ncbi:MAG: hypothetical protein PUE84_10625 [Firmicutes bacterium]|nr:hypothetical protein [Bacillota bacterium]